MLHLTSNCYEKHYLQKYYFHRKGIFVQEKVIKVGINYLWEKNYC